MPQTDCRGLALTTDVPGAAARLDAAVHAVLAHRPDAMDHARAALAADPGLVLGHALAGLLLCLLARGELDPQAAAHLAAARAGHAARGGTAREAAATAALAAWQERGAMEHAAALLEQATLAEPRDALSLKLAQSIRFMLGDAAGMGAAIARALPAWDAATPGYGYILGCHAFALEEAGDRRGAERTGRHAVEIAPDDLWASHAVAHVLEAEGRAREGIAWLGAADGALPGGAFARHLFWHRALFHLHLDEGEAALALYDARVRDVPTEEYRDIANAASLLWRLGAQGVPVGRRWEELADIAERRIGDHRLAFADLHHVLSLAASSRHAALRRFLAGLRERALDDDSQAQVIARVGLPAARAVAAAFGAAPVSAAGLVAPLRGEIGAIGGSHAQRDVFERLALAATLAQGDHAATRALLADRATRRVPGAWEAALQRAAQAPATLPQAA